ncbi:phosphotransferase [Micromonospora sp. GCM10011542]|uniref:phosphotransferase n=1 Tax=Micromonospora sp. GCM10011542 TaxID=3317337 RepID=UPI0036131575
MIDDPSPSVSTWVREDFGIELDALEPVTHGADQQARLWRARAVDGTGYAVKLSGGGTPAGLLVTAHLAGQGVRGVAAPLPTRDGRLYSRREGRRLSVVPWVSDERALGGAMTLAHWRAYGEVLAAVHAAAVTDDLAELLPRGGGTYQRILTATRAQAGRLRDPGRAGAVAELAEVWASVADPVAALIRAVERLAVEVRDRPGPAVVCHGDPHLGNLLLGPDGQVWLIDWDDAVLAPRECDLMFILGGVLAFAPVTGEQQAAALAGYGAVDVDPARLAWFLAVRALDDLSDWTRQALDPDASAADRSFAVRIVRGLVSPDGLVTLATSALRDLDRSR